MYSAAAIVLLSLLNLQLSTSSVSKQSQECTNSSVQIEHATFQTICGMGFASYQVLQIIYVDTFVDCMTACVNLDEPAPCLGVNWVNDVNSTEVQGGLCWMVFDVKNPTTSSSADIAILVNRTSSGNQTSPPVYSV